jgi:hypothetical protein
MSDLRIFRVTFEVEIEVDAPDQAAAIQAARMELANGAWSENAITSVRDRGTADGDE